MDRILESWRWIVDEPEQGTRLDQFVSEQDVGPTRSQLKRLIERGFVLVDGAPSRPARKLRAGQTVFLGLPPPEPLAAEPEDIPLHVLHEDDALVVVNKPQGLVVHPAPGHPRGTLVNGLLFGRSTSGGDPLRPGIVHRLDKDTSGLMVVAKREDVHADLARQFHERTVERCYRVLVAGNPPDAGEWSTLHGRRSGDRKRFSTMVTRGKPAISIFRVLERFAGAALLEVRLKTGRTHQVRVHCKDHGFGVLGDPWYGPGRGLAPELRAVHRSLTGQALHAAVLGFTHPLTGERLRFEVEPPPEFTTALESLRALRNSPD